MKDNSKHCTRTFSSRDTKQEKKVETDRLYFYPAAAKTLQPIHPKGSCEVQHALDFKTSSALWDFARVSQPFPKEKSGRGKIRLKSATWELVQISRFLLCCCSVTDVSVAQQRQPAPATSIRYCRVLQLRWVQHGGSQAGVHRWIMGKSSYYFFRVLKEIFQSRCIIVNIVKIHSKVVEQVICVVFGYLFWSTNWKIPSCTLVL